MAALKNKRTHNQPVKEIPGLEAGSLVRETKHLLLPGSFPQITRKSCKVLQVNLGYRCNQSCTHCHVNAGPKRTEMMSEATLDSLVDLLARGKFSLLDITGGAPELHPGFRRLVSEARNQGVPVRDRCNLTILFCRGDFVTRNAVELSVPLGVTQRIGILWRADEGQQLSGHARIIRD